MKLKTITLLVSSLFFFPFSSLQAEECSLKYTLKGWAAFYKTYNGTGVVSCPSGKRAKVNLSLKGGGFTFGAYEITDGKGTIRGINNIDDIYGGSFMIDGDAGFIKSVEGRWVPKGSRSVTLSGKGTGYHLGWAMGSFRITKP